METGLSENIGNKPPRECGGKDKGKDSGQARLQWKNERDGTDEHADKTEGRGVRGRACRKVRDDSGKVPLRSSHPGRASALGRQGGEGRGDVRDIWRNPGRTEHRAVGDDSTAEVTPLI